MAGRASKQAEAMSYETLRQKIFAIAQKDHPLMEDFIPFEVGTYWLIGQTLVRHAEELLESLALILESNMEAPGMSLDEVLDVGR